MDSLEKKNMTVGQFSRAMIYFTLINVTVQIIFKSLFGNLGEMTLDQFNMIMITAFGFYIIYIGYTEN